MSQPLSTEIRSAASAVFDILRCLKVIESVTESGRCDFCQVNEPKHTINGGMWWICTPCMHLEYGIPDQPEGWGEEE